MIIANDWPACDVSMRRVEDLAPYARNPRTHSDRQVEKIAASIGEWGWTNPVLVDEEGGIIAGHGRVLAAERLEIEEIPCSTARGWTKAQKRAYVIADNQLALDAGWDLDLLRGELDDLRGLDFDVDLVGFDDLSFLDGSDGLGGGEEEPGGEAPEYTQKIVTPVYEPSGPAPEVAELADRTFTDELVAEIEAMDIADSEFRDFMLSAAERHTVFRYDQIANYYAQATPEVKALFERSVLVILDADQAIERGFVELNSRIGDLFATDYPDA